MTDTAVSEIKTSTDEGTQAVVPKPKPKTSTDEGTQAVVPKPKPKARRSSGNNADQKRLIDSSKRKKA